MLCEGERKLQTCGISAEVVAATVCRVHSMRGIRLVGGPAGLGFASLHVVQCICLCVGPGYGLPG